METLSGIIAGDAAHHVPDSHGLAGDCKGLDQHPGTSSGPDPATAAGTPASLACCRPLTGCDDCSAREVRRSNYQSLRATPIRSPRPTGRGRCDGGPQRPGGATTPLASGAQAGSRLVPRAWPAPTSGHAVDVQGRGCPAAAVWCWLPVRCGCPGRGNTSVTRLVPNHCTSRGGVPSWWPSRPEFGIGIPASG